MSPRVSLPCPTCGGPLPSEVPESDLPTNKWPHRPFCSDRCRLIDLGKWFDGKYVIPGPPADPEEAERNGS